MLRRLNGIRYGNPIRLHQQIKIPLDRLSKEEFEEARMTYHKKIQEAFFSEYKIQRVHTYRVRSGDNIWTLCHEKFDMPLWLFKRYNPEVEFTDLKHAQKLNIPIIVSFAENSPVT